MDRDYKAPKGGFRAGLAILSARFVRRVLRILGRGGTALPGKVAMKFKADVLGVVASGVDTVVVTGTNGKTTTANMIESALTESGKEVLANKSGANLLSGVTAEFLAVSTLGGKCKKKYAVIECDEGALKHVVPLVRPRVIVVTNLFRDQLDRYGEIMNVLKAIKEGASRVPDTTLVLNADESLTASLAEDLPNEVVFYGLNVPVGDQSKRVTSDASHCVKCGEEYEYDYYTYEHLGGFKCPKCGYKRKTPLIGIKSIDETTPDYSRVTVLTGEEEKNVLISLPATYNIYNAAAAIAAYRAYGENIEDIIATLGRIRSAFGRMETFDFESTTARMILVKNPAGGNQTLEYLESINEDFILIAALNDKIADGTDISWIWDMDYEKLSGFSHIKRLVVTGDRREELALRLKYAGVEEIDIIEDYKDVLEIVRTAQIPVFLIPNYTTMLALRDLLKSATGAKDYWEKL